MAKKYHNNRKPERKPLGLSRNIIPILRSYGVKKAALFGSFVRGEAKSKSDLDILVEFEQARSLFDLVALEIALENAIKRKVDVLTYNSIHPFLRRIIFREQKRIL